MRKFGLLIIAVLLIFGAVSAQDQPDIKLHAANTTVTIEEDSYLVP